MTAGGKRKGSGRKPGSIKRVVRSYRLAPEVAEFIKAAGGAQYIEQLVNDRRGEENETQAAKED